MRNVDLTQRILELAGKPESLIQPVADRPGHDRRYSLDTTKLRALGWAPQVAFDARPGRDRRVVPRERVVVAADQGRRSRVPRLLPGAVPASAASDEPCPAFLWSPAPPVSRAATRRRLLEHEPRWRHGRTGAATAPWPTRRPVEAVDLLDRGGGARARSATLRPSVIYHCAGIAHVGESWTAGARAARQRPRHAPRPRRGARRRARAVRVLVTGSALVYRPSHEPLDEDDPLGPVGSVRREQARAGDARAARDGDCPVVHRASVQPRRTPSGADVLDVELRAADRRDRSGQSRARAPRRQPRVAPRHHGRARHGARVRRVVQRGRPRAPVQRLLRARLPGPRSARRARRRCRRVPITIEVDPARLRPSDNPVIAGDRARITRRNRLGAVHPDRTDAGRSPGLLAAADHAARP